MNKLQPRKDFASLNQWGGQIYNAAKQVFGERKYVFILLLFASFFFGLFVYIPVATTPGNSFAFQLSIFRAQDYFLMVFLAFLVGLNFSMNIYALRKQKVIGNSVASPVRNREGLQRAISNGASGTVSGFGGAFAAIVGTATCASCLAFLFGIVGLGIGSVIFVLKYQTLFLLGAIALVVISLYFTARKVNRHCASCQ